MRRESSRLTNTLLRRRDHYRCWIYANGEPSNAIWIILSSHNSQATDLSVVGWQKRVRRVAHAKYNNFYTVRYQYLADIVQEKMRALRN